MATPGYSLRLAAVESILASTGSSAKDQQLGS